MSKEFEKIVLKKFEELNNKIGSKLGSLEKKMDSKIDNLDKKFTAFQKDITMKLMNFEKFTILKFEELKEVKTDLTITKQKVEHMEQILEKNNT